MKYPKWAPKLLLLASLSLGSCDLQEKTDEIKHKIEKVFITEYQPEYIKNGRNRLLRVKGKNLDKLHTTAVKEFIREIEKEIKIRRMLILCLYSQSQDVVKAYSD